MTINNYNKQNDLDLLSSIVAFIKIINEKMFAFKFLARCHLGFYYVTALSLLSLKKAQLLLFETIGHHSDVMKSKMVALGKYKSDN